ncbi:hypothetical protein [Natrinema sp. CGMCC1.2065]|uniref:hypothetical protein n=1 Tax=Natrinema sp. CGMCC1.2065 TaxID=3445767 RepID=UPI003F4A0447
MFISAGTVTTITALAGCIGGSSNNDDGPNYDDDLDKYPDANDIDAETELIDDDSDEYDVGYTNPDESVFAGLIVGIGDTVDEAEDSMSDIVEDMMVRGANEVDIADNGQIGELDGFTVLAFRDSNAVGTVVAGQLTGFSLSPADTLAMDVAESTINHWRDQ